MGEGIALKNIFVSDLDGTLLRSNQTLSDYTIRIVNEAVYGGNIVSFATARGLFSAKSVVSAIEWKHPVILYNGALLYDVAQDQVMDGYWLNNELTTELIGMGKQFGLSPFYFSLDANHQERVYHEALSTFGMVEFLKSRSNDPRFCEVDQLKAFIGSRTLALTYIGEWEMLIAFKEEVTVKIGEQLNCHMMKDYYIPNQYFLEFSHPLASKREGLALWARHMNVNPKQICIFGDQLNDLGLFEAAGQKVAVANAHHDILKLADKVIESNDEDGVAKYIEACLRTRDSLTCY